VSETKIGTIKFYKHENGYGFIKTEDRTDYFFHISDLIDENYRPRPDDRVRFTVVTAKKGLRASSVSQC
jgi:cold shock CspA family protein